MRNFLLILAFVGIFYGTSLKFSFSQDDFFFLELSHASSWQEVAKFFSPYHQQGFPFYRPLGTQLYFYVAQALSGENAPLFMHLFMIGLQALNGYLVYGLLRRLKLVSPIPLLAGILYAVSAAHFLSLFYIAATQQLLAMTFMLLAMHAYLRRSIMGVVSFFSLALLSKETAIILPVIVVLLSVLTGEKRIKQIVKTSLPLWVVLGVYLLVRILAGIQVQGEYHPDLSIRVATTVQYYLLFTLGLPEHLLNYGLTAGRINWGQYLTDSGPLGYLNLGTALAFLLLLGVNFFQTARKGKLPLGSLALLALWWGVGLATVIFFPDHRYPHYLDLSLVGFLLGIALVLPRRAFLPVSLLLLASFWSGIKLSTVFHWTVNRARIASHLEERMLGEGACRGQALLIIGEGNVPREVSYALSREHGVRYICQNRQLQVYYQGLDHAGEPVDTVLEVDRSDLQ